MIPGNVTEMDIPIGFKIDIGEIQEDQYKEELPGQEEEEPEIITEEAAQVEEDHKDDAVIEDEDPFKEYSESAIIAISEIRDGSFDGLEEKDIPKDLNPIALRDLYRKASEIRLKEEISTLKDAAGDAGKYVEYLLSGGDPLAVKEAIQLKDLLTLDVNEEENQKKLIAEDLRRRGVEDDEIQDLVENILDKGKGKQKAEQVIKLLQKQEDDILEYSKEQRRLQLESEREMYDTYVSNVKGTIQKAEINGVKISKQEQKALEAAIFSPTEIIEVPHPETGKPQKVRATKIQVLQNQLNSDYEKLVSFYYWLHKGGKFDFVKEQAKEEEQDSLRSLLQGRSTVRKKVNTENSQDKLLKALIGK